MWTVVLALLPAGAAGVFIFGLSALYVTAISVLTAVATEAAVLSVRKKDIVAIWDGSAILTGLLLAYNLPPEMPLWMTVAGSFFAIAIGKQAFGGLGHNIFNPALVGRSFLMISWPVYMTTWQNPRWAVDAVTSATPLALCKNGGECALLKSVSYWKLKKILVRWRAAWPESMLRLSRSRIVNCSSRGNRFQTSSATFRSAIMRPDRYRSAKSVRRRSPSRPQRRARSARSSSGGTSAKERYRRCNGSRCSSTSRWVMRSATISRAVEGSTSGRSPSARMVSAGAGSGIWSGCSRGRRTICPANSRSGGITIPRRRLILPRISARTASTSCGVRERRRAARSTTNWTSSAMRASGQASRASRIR
ncbi:MAG: RnfABCDGE type electron transport complex subunit D [candidate division NC10 bacterium]